MQVTLIHPGDNTITETLVPASVSTTRGRVRIKTGLTPDWEQEGMEIVASNHGDVRLSGRVDALHTKMRGHGPNLRVYHVAEDDPRVSWA